MGEFGAIPVATAAPSPTASITSTLYCYPEAAPGYGERMYPAPSAQAQVNNGSGGELVSGSVTGLTPGHSYYYLSNKAKHLDDISGELGTADESGALSFQNVRTSATFAGPLHAGQADQFGIYDSADNSTNPTPAVTGSTAPIAANPNCATLKPGTYLTQLTTTSGVRLIMQSDGNLVLYSGSKALWSTRTSGHPGARAILQSDGNLVVYGPTNQVLWYSHTSGHPNAHLWVQEDGNLVIYQASGGAIWQTRTKRS